MKEKEVMSEMLEIIIAHLQFSPDTSIKEFVAGCYEDIYKKEGKPMHKSREKELEYLLKQDGAKLREGVVERYLRGFEETRAVGMKRTREMDTSMMKAKGRPKKKGRK
jgi:hypothetical protein